MIIISDAFGNVQSIIPDKIYQGSNNANEIYYIAPFSASNVVTITFELPVSINGLPVEYIMKNPTKISNDHNIWRTKIELPVTQYYGSVKYQIKVTNQTGEIVAISRSTFEVIRGVDIVLPEQPSEDVYQQLLSALSQVYSEANNKVDVLFENKIESQKQTILNDSNEISLNIECVEFTFKFTNLKTAVAYESYIDAEDNKYKISINNNIYTIQVNNSNDIITLISDSGLTYESYIDSNENNLIEIDDEAFLIKQSTKILESGKKLIISKHGIYIDEKSDDKKILLPNEIQEKINNLIKNHNENSEAHQDIRDLIRTIQTSSNYLRVGEITTEKISPELDAEIYIENVINPDDNLVQTNFTFKLPSGGTAVKVDGEIQPSINVVQETGESTKDVMSQKAVTDNFSNSVHITEQTLTNKQKNQARTNIGALSSADLTMWSQRLYEEPDLNTLANIGNGKAYISKISPITANTPKSNIYGNVISFRSAGGQFTQIVMETQSGKMYYRASATSEGFGTWKELVLTQSIDLSNTGYVAFSNGLKIQWGRANMPSEIEVGGLITPTVSLPISMTSENYKILGSTSRSDVNIGYGDTYANSFVLGLRNLGSSAITTSSTYSWVIIGW